MGARKPADNGDSDPGKGGEDYLSKRARNNEAVKRSREKARQKAKETHDRVTKLKNENEMLEERIKLLSKELTFLKDIFLAHAGELTVQYSIEATEEDNSRSFYFSQFPSLARRSGFQLLSAGQK